MEKTADATTQHHHHSSYTQLIHSAARGNRSWTPTDTHGLRPTLVPIPSTPHVSPYACPSCERAQR
eukprot:scaffold17103_cov154-Isochrysis_galbana.AAC.2